MQYPRIHLNGTDGHDLLGEYERAARAVSAAISHVQNVTVHGRDYYPIGSDAIDNAIIEHRERLSKLKQIERELHAIANDIHEQLAERSKA